MKNIRRQKINRYARSRSAKKIMFEGSEEDLKNTQNAQPAIFAASMACFEVLKQSADLNKFEIITAGHSLGEYSAMWRGRHF
jgi:[acyl-carrier-protein] S-malonyltransferase